MNIEYWLNPATYGMDAGTMAILIMVVSAIGYKLGAIFTYVHTLIYNRFTLQLKVTHVTITFAMIEEWAIDNVEHSVLKLRGYSIEGKLPFWHRVQ
jgi:hypothetical protein